MDQAVSVKKTRAAMITDMPTDCLEHIMQRLSLTNVFRIMRVCREWKFAAKTVVRNWSVLKISDGQAMDHNSVRVGVNDREDKQILSSLMLMHNLRSFSFKPSMDDATEVHWKTLLLQNSASLQWLHYPRLMVSPGEQFPRLQTLYWTIIYGQDAASLAAALPSIKNIWFWSDYDLSILHHVPHEQMVGLCLVIRLLNAAAVESLLQSLLKMVGLKKLTLMSDIDQPLLRRLCSGFRRLTHVQLFLKVVNIDAAVTHLVASSPDLKSVRIHAVSMSNETLHQLTRLQHLTDLCLVDGAFSAEGVCAFLSGPFRASLQTVIISFTGDVALKENLKKIEDEIAKMLAETGKTAETAKVNSLFMSLRLN